MAQLNETMLTKKEERLNNTHNSFDFLISSFQEFSPIWLILSAGIGGFIGATIKFIFEQLLEPKLKRKRESKIALKKYSDPLLRSADSLDRRLENFIKFVNEKWFDDKKDDYYKISTLYLFGSYFGWSKIIENEAYLEFETSKTEKNFYINFNRVYKGLTGFQYFKDLDKDVSPQLGIHRLVLTAIGELMIKENLEKQSKELISFIEFTEKYSFDSNFKKWFKSIEDLFSDTTNSSMNPKWNRLIIFATNLRVFIHFLDSSNRLTKSRKILIQGLHPKIKENLLKEIKKAGYLSLIDDG